MFRKVILCLVCLTAFADDKAVPLVSDKSRAAFWRAVAEQTQANAAKLAADAKQKEAVEAMQKECGAWTLTLDQKTGEPVCVEPPKVEEKK
jgi:hypothetical protein